MTIKQHLPINQKKGINILLNNGKRKRHLNNWESIVSTLHIPYNIWGKSWKSVLPFIGFIIITELGQKHKKSRYLILNLWREWDAPILCHTISVVDFFSCHNISSARATEDWLWDSSFVGAYAVLLSSPQLWGTLSPEGYKLSKLLLMMWEKRTPWHCPIITLGTPIINEVLKDTAKVCASAMVGAKVQEITASPSQRHTYLITKGLSWEEHKQMNISEGEKGLTIKLFLPFLLRIEKPKVVER